MDQSIDVNENFITVNHAKNVDGTTIKTQTFS